MESILLKSGTAVNSWMNASQRLSVIEKKWEIIIKREKMQAEIFY